MHDLKYAFRWSEIFESSHFFTNLYRVVVALKCICFIFLIYIYIYMLVIMFFSVVRKVVKIVLTGSNLLGYLVASCILDECEFS
jgi:hypothetical protein